MPAEGIDGRHAAHASGKTGSRRNRCRPCGSWRCGSDPHTICTSAWTDGSRRGQQSRQSFTGARLELRAHSNLWRRRSGRSGSRADRWPGADMVFDGVGAATFNSSLACLKPFGHLALFGQASGPVASVEFAQLAAKSLSDSRAVVFHHVGNVARYPRSGELLFSLISSGAINIRPPRTYPLGDAAAAHAELESGLTSGSTILLP